MRALIFLLLSTAATAQTVYSWTDRDGVVHFTDDVTTVPKEARTAPSSAAELGALSVISKQPEAPIPYVNLERWRNDLPACRNALAHFRARRVALATEETKLNQLKQQFAPCQRFVDVCYDKNLTLETWRRECRERPRACDFDPRPQEYAVAALREEVDQLPAWMRKVAVVCAR